MTDSVPTDARRFYVRRDTTVADWTREDDYQNSLLHTTDSVLEDALKVAKDADLPDISVSKAQGKYLNLLVRSLGAKRILELGTLGGYSTICMARGLPDDGELITCELNEKCIAVAGKNIANAGLSSKVKILQGPAAETISNLPAAPSFDLIFIDADKPNNPKYFTEAKRLVRKGGVIIVDNVVRNGRVSDMEIQRDVNVEGVRNLLRLIRDDKEVEASTIQTVGEKGYDGFLYALRL